MRCARYRTKMMDSHPISSERVAAAKITLATLKVRLTISHAFSALRHTHHMPHAPHAVLYFVPILIGYWLC